MPRANHLDWFRCSARKTCLRRCDGVSIQSLPKIEIAMCVRFSGKMHCATPQQRKVVLSDFLLSWAFLRFSSTFSDHAFRTRLPTTLSGHAFRPRFLNRGTSFSSKLGSWVGAQRLRARGKPFSGFGPDDREAPTIAFFSDSCTNLCCPQLDYTLWTLSQRTLIRHLLIPSRFCIGHFVENNAMLQDCHWVGCRFGHLLHDVHVLPQLEALVNKFLVKVGSGSTPIKMRVR